MQTRRNWYLFRMNIEVLLLLMVLSSTSYVTKGNDNVCTELNQLTLLQRGKRLLNYMFVSFKTDGVQQCARACLNRKSCKSFNFKIIYGYCELNRNISIETSMVETNVEYVYSEIRQWPQTIAGECADHPCGHQETCRALAQNQVTCDACSNASSCGSCYPVTDIVGRQFTSYGCFRSTPTRVLPHSTVNLRGEIVWTDMTLTIKGCAIEANITGKQLFGVEFFGECYVGDILEANFENAVSTYDCQTDCWNGVGRAEVMYVYQWI